MIERPEDANLSMTTGRAHHRARTGRCLTATAISIVVACLFQAGFVAAAGSSPQSGAITEANLTMHDEFWPDKAQLVEPLLGAKGEMIVPTGRLGVLVWIREDGRARVDFGRFGPHTVPVAQTDLVEGTNAIRRGERTKTLPNLLLMISTRLADSMTSDLRLHPVVREANDEFMLLLFADPRREAFGEIVRRVAPISGHERIGVTALVPLTSERDLETLGRLKAANWKSPFLIGRFAESYAEAMIEPNIATPFLRLATANGRIVVEGPAHEETIEAIRAVLTSSAH